MRGQRAHASHLPAKPTQWQQGPCHFGSMNIHYWQVTSNTYTAVNPERYTPVNLIKCWWKGMMYLAWRVAEAEGAEPCNGRGSPRTQLICSVVRSHPISMVWSRLDAEIKTDPNTSACLSSQLARVLVARLAVCKNIEVNDQALFLYWHVTATMVYLNKHPPFLTIKTIIA